ncbi:hypothetical protein ASC77_07945 [Nocardioides sp. Root1257]|uniref:GNAT family N-acetyltransferase n=1 Tax=unclassified Nocardioides TaxID=2615069 RepID=UPI0006FCB544|nr:MULTISPECIES: GNAT family N-acetyltransferase [unclassified Nocardioides]KQW48661.1 hypothetical protein ASC77_07945 [Nocardioides sp. Root1257]KRC47836.1 hypothetical protein ASE24_07950 [Nocardioides sp. Root224]
MDDAERVRADMGAVMATLAARIGAVADAGPDWWLGLTGGVAPDLNMALLATADPVVLDGTMTILDEAGLDALVFLAGPGRELATRFAAPWVGVGAAPVMTRDLTTGPAEVVDGRVRQAGPADAAVLADLIAEAFSLSADDTALMAAGAVPGGVIRAWLLEDGGEAVSALVSGHVDDGVSIWAMSTPARFARRGYGRALLGSVLAHARADGARVGMLGATPAGLPLYEATGWRTLEEWELFTNAASAQFGH